MFKKIKIIVISFMLSSTTLYGQEILTYSGPYELNGENDGEAIYNYFINDSDIQIKQGYFIYEKRQFQNSQLTQSKYNGNYENGRKDGKWLYEDNIFDLEVLGVSSDMELEKNLRGVKSTLNAHYNRGRANSTWVYEQIQVHNNKKEKLTTATFTFSEGRLTGNFSYNSTLNLEPLKVQGSFNKEHFFDGNWILEYVLDSVPYKETRVYEDGFLLSIQVMEKGKQEPIYDVEYDVVVDKLNRVRDKSISVGYSVDDKFFGFLFDDGFHEFSEKERSQIQGNQILDKVIGQFTGERLQGLALGGIVEIEPGATRRFKYAYTDEQYAAIDKAEELIAQNISDVQKFVENASLAINRHRSDTLAFTFKLMASTIDKMKILEKEIEMIKSEDFRYQSLENYYRRGIVGITAADTITYTYQGEQNFRVVPNPRPITDGENIINEINDYLLYKEALIEEVSPFLRANLIEIEQEIQIQELEGSMMALMDSVYILYQAGEVSEADINNLSFQLKRSLDQSFRNRLDRKLQDYGEESDVETKENIGREIVELGEAFVEIHSLVEGIDKKMRELDNAYTVYTDNPFLQEYNLKTRIKRNVYTAATETLIPYLVQSLAGAQSPEEIINKSKLISSSFERLIEISEKEDRETRSLERRLRRNVDAETIMDLLDIDLSA